MGVVEDRLNSDAESGIAVVTMVALLFWSRGGILSTGNRGK